MPTMKEIAEALMIGAVNTSMLADDVEDEKLAAKLELEVKLLQYLANQLEQTRCETCEWFDDIRPTGVLISWKRV